MDSVDASNVEGTVRRIEVRCAMNRMKIGKANGPSRVAIKLLMVGGDKQSKVLDGCLHEKVDIDKMQYGFMPGRGTVDAVFVLRR